MFSRDFGKMIDWQMSAGLFMYVLLAFSGRYTPGPNDPTQFQVVFGILFLKCVVKLLFRLYKK